MAPYFDLHSEIPLGGWTQDSSQSFGQLGVRKWKTCKPLKDLIQRLDRTRVTGKQEVIEDLFQLPDGRPLVHIPAGEPSRSTHDWKKLMRSQLQIYRAHSKIVGRDRVAISDDAELVQ